VLQGCSHYNTSKSLKSKSGLNLSNSVRAGFCLLSLQSSHTSYHGSFPISASRLCHQCQEKISDKKVTQKMLLVFLVLSIPLVQFRLETSELVAIRKQPTLVGKGKPCQRRGKRLLTQLCC